MHVMVEDKSAIVKATGKVVPKVCPVGQESMLRTQRHGNLKYGVGRKLTNI